MLRLRYNEVPHIYASTRRFMRLQMCVASMAALLISQAEAVEVGKPSKTSIGSTAARALAARDYDPSVRNSDWLAEAFLGPTEREILADDPAIKKLELDYREAIKDPGI